MAKNIKSLQSTVKNGFNLYNFRIALMDKKSEKLKRITFMTEKDNSLLLGFDFDKPEKKTRKKSSPTAATAETMASKQRDISISEFFAKNRHLLGFDNPKRALLTTIKEAVDNALDACDEAHILPDIYISIKQISDGKYDVLVRDNGPGIVKRQVPNIFARLLYGSKFHSLKMSRGQQGIGISAAGMYGLITTGEPVEVISRTNPHHHGYYCKLKIDTSKNRPVIVEEGIEENFPHPTGTSVRIIMEGRYNKGKQSVDEYIIQTAMANPHASITYDSPDNEHFEYKRQSDEMPFIPIEIKPHPYGVEIGMLFKMAQETNAKKMPEFLHSEFSRVSIPLAKEMTKQAGLSLSLKPSKAELSEIEQLYKVINNTKIMAPSTNCIGPIGEERLEEGLRRVVEAEFYTACTRKPSVYRGNPFLVEAALAYGFNDPNSDKDDDGKQMMQLKRIANRVPLLYQQSSGAIHKAVLDTNWRNYGLSQSKGAMPAGALMLMVHVASVWVPFTSESKEAVAHYPEIIKEIKLAVQECGRKLGVHLKRQKKIKQELVKRGYIKTYLPHIGEALRDILELSDVEVDEVVEKLQDTLERSRKF